MSLRPLKNGQNAKSCNIYFITSFLINMPKNIELYFQWVNYIGCGLYLNKAISKMVGGKECFVFFNDPLQASYKLDMPLGGGIAVL